MSKLLRTERFRGITQDDVARASQLSLYLVTSFTNFKISIFLFFFSSPLFANFPPFFSMLKEFSCATLRFFARFSLKSQDYLYIYIYRICFTSHKFYC